MITEKRILTAKEVRDTVADDDFVWVELRKGNYGADVDEVYCLRAQIATPLFIDFSIPRNLLHCKLEDYGIAWRIWNHRPEWGHDDPWEE